MDQISEIKVNALEGSFHHEARLTSTELGNLWTSYMTYSMLTPIFTYYTQIAENPEILSLMDQSLQIVRKRKHWVANILSKEDRVIPAGFSEDDLREDAPRLYEDVFFLFYLRNMIKIQLATNSLFFTTSTRADVREMYQQFNIETMDLYQKVTDLMLSKGILVRPPQVPLVNQVDFIKEPNFLTGFWGEKRPLLALEISSLHYLILTNFVGKSLLQGFCQVAELPAVREYMDRGIRLAAKVMDTSESYLKNESIQLPMFWDSMVTDSKKSPFSDKLMLYHTIVLDAAGFLNIGAALSTSLRHDVSAGYMKMLADIVGYAEAGTKLMITNGWLEEPPRYLDQKEIRGLKH